MIRGKLGAILMLIQRQMPDNLDLSQCAVVFGKRSFVDEAFRKAAMI